MCPKVNLAQAYQLLYIYGPRIGQTQEEKRKDLHWIKQHCFNMLVL